MICSVIGFFILIGTLYDVCILQFPSSVRFSEKRSNPSVQDENTSLINNGPSSDKAEDGALRAAPQPGMHVEQQSKLKAFLKFIILPSLESYIDRSGIKNDSLNYS